MTLFPIFLVFFMFVMTPNVECESILVTQTALNPNINGSDTSYNPNSQLEERIENLSFNVRYLQEVFMKWKVNFQLIDNRISKLEKQVKMMTTRRKSTTTTTTTNSQRQIQEPEMNLT